MNTSAIALICAAALAAANAAAAPAADNRQADRVALKTLVDTFSNLADEKRTQEQLPLFTEDAELVSRSGGQEFVLKGRQAIGAAFDNYLAGFSAVYHLNGQHTVHFTGPDTAEGISYCAVKLLDTRGDRKILHDRSVRYQDSYVKQNGTWRIQKRISDFMIDDVRELGAAK